MSIMLYATDLTHAIEASSIMLPLTRRSEEFYATSLLIEQDKGLSGNQGKIVCVARKERGTKSKDVVHRPAGRQPKPVLHATYISAETGNSNSLITLSVE
jgi:hypothetical protein